MTPRLLRRLWRHHLPLALVTLAAGLVLYVTRPTPDVLSRLSFASAYPALVLLAVTLVIGPWRVLRKKAPLLSQDMRRDIGIWAGMTGLFHAGVGQFVHLRGKPWLYYIYEKWNVMPLRHDMFGVANFTGLFATLVLIALLATSSDMALRRLGTPGWKSLQRWNYACFALTALHAFGYQSIERQALPYVGFTLLCVVATILLQFAAWRSRRPILR